MVGSLLLAATLSAASDYAFAFADASGKRLLALGAVPEPARLTRATCDGEVVRVAFLAQQPRGANDLARQTPGNFEQVEGALYALEAGTIAPGASCLLATAELFRARPPVAVTAEETPCDAETGAAVARLGKRSVERCHEIGGFPGGRLALVTFARTGKDALAGLVLLAGKVATMRSFPAVFGGDATSCWRVDDGCVFEPGAYHVPFVLTGGGAGLFALWDGPEGQKLELLESRRGALEPSAAAYRYWAPL